MTVAQLLRDADSRELSQWRQFLRVEAEREEDRRRTAELERSLNA